MSDPRRNYSELALLPVASLNSGDTGNNTEINGLQVDTQVVTRRRYRRVRVSIPFRTVLATARRVSLLSNLQDREATSGAGSTWADFGTAPAAFVRSTTGTVNRPAFEYEQDLTSARRYLRVQFTPRFQTGAGVLTTATGNTMSYSGALIFHDANRLPASG